MMSLGDNKIQWKTLFYENDSNCSASIDSYEAKRRIQNKDKEAAYNSKIISFLIGLQINTGRATCYDSKYKKSS